MARRLLLLCVLMSACVSLTFAQNREITGTVTDGASGFPLPGVNIVIQGTTTGTTSNIDGGYSIRAGNDDVLVFSFVGYLPQEVTVGNQNTIDVTLEEDVELLEEVVVVGYGTQRRADVTGAVSTVDVADANVGLVTSPEQLIQGRVAGVQVLPNNGEPGASVNIRIRGGTSISASNDPLYVIDGVPLDNSSTTPPGGAVSSGGRNPLSFLNPNDIESIDILKDASAAAIYGSRGANGVVLITTKKGRQGQVQVDYDGYVSSSSAANTLDLLSASEYRNAVADQFGANSEELNSLRGANTDWQDEIFQTAVSQSHNLAFSGGTVATQYRASLGYLDQEGPVIDSGLRRVSGRLNANHTAFNDKLDLGLNLTAAFTEDDHSPYQQTGGFSGGMFTNLLKMLPTNPVEDPDASDGYFETGDISIRNPVAMAEQIADFTKTTRVLGNLTAEYEFAQGLTGRLNIGADRRQASRRAFVPRESPIGETDGGRADQANREFTSQLIEFTGNYNRIFNDVHNVSLLGGYSWQDFLFEEFRATARDFITDAFSFNNLGGGANYDIRPSSQRQLNKLISFFGRVNYDYDSRYIFSASLRRDGSSRFGADNKWGVFPAVTLGWRLSQESFMQGVDFVDDLKLRVGYGVNGSQEIGNLRSLPTLTANTGFTAIIGGNEVVGVAANNFANPDLKWEETTQLNIGLDYSFMTGRVTGSLEYYFKNTDDLLLELEVPQPAVVSTRLENVGEIQNQGIEVAVNAFVVDRGDLTVELGGTFNMNRNEVVSLGDRERIFTGTVSGAGQSGVNSQIVLPGEPFGTFYGPVFTGIDENGAQQFEDLDGDGTLEIFGDDRTIIGSAQPDFTYGLTTNATFKSWDFSFFLRGTQGNDIFNNTALEYTTKDNLGKINLLAEALTDGTAINEVPVYSSRWIQDGSFLRLETLTLGYTFNNVNAFQDYLGVIRRARVYASAQNLFVLTSYDGFDPEVNTSAGVSLGAGGGGGTAPLAVPSLGIDYTNYPRPRSFTLGVSLGF